MANSATPNPNLVVQFDTSFELNWVFLDKLENFKWSDSCHRLLRLVFLSILRFTHLDFVAFIYRLLHQTENLAICHSLEFAFHSYFLVVDQELVFLINLID